MSQRHAWAVNATNISDLGILAQLLTGAVTEAAKEGQMAHLDPAVNLIAHQISLVANGDSATRHYDLAYDYCAARATNFEYIKIESPAILAN